MRIGVSTVGLVISAAVLLVASKDVGAVEPEYVLDRLHIIVTVQYLRLVVFNEFGKVALNGNLGAAVSPDLGPPSECQDAPICLEWTDATKLKISTEDGGYFVEWTTNGASRLEDRFDMTVGPWYGGGENYYQGWPISNSPMLETAYVTGDMIGNHEWYAGVLESYWLSATGAALYVPEDIPLFISVNSEISNYLVMAAENKHPYWTNDAQSLSLKYHILVNSDAVSTHLWAVSKYLGKPQGLIDDRIVRDPIWSTWARYKRNVTQDTVLAFAQEIRLNNCSYSHLEIDDKWEPCYGKFSFDSSKFEDPAAMISQLHDMGYRVTTWVYPFVNTDCDTFQEASDNGYLVKSPDGSTGLTSWWEGAEAGSIDFTNPEAVAWYTSVLEKLRQDTGLDGFKFDAGETNWLPDINLLNSPLELQPNSYSTAFVNTVAPFGNFGEVRTGRRTQSHAVMVRMLDKDSHWGYDNGLKTIVTTMLQFNMVGYPYVLADMIGGNGYDVQPSRELYVRWLQANTFMPVLQFSYVPWDFDDEIVEIARRYIDLHRQYADTILALASKTMIDGTPINLPLWWIAPNDEVAQTIDSEYLLGSTVLVAPVMDEGATSRDIYLPEGRWRDELDPNHPEYDGPQWLRNYPAPLADLPYFTRLV